MAKWLSKTKRCKRHAHSKTNYNKNNPWQKNRLWTVSDSVYFASVENSVHLAIDTGIQDIIVTGDFNFDMLSPNLSGKIRNLCLQFSLTQTINEPTHYTENSSSLLDLIVTSNNTQIIFSGVGDPFLNQELRFHCPVYGILNFSKPKNKSYLQQIWSYDQGDYNLLRKSFTHWLGHSIRPWC